jgi:2-polyprenyl-3-methyl-5-hydroxy-6-metoxy-1,4-benzoquinol methylase
MKEKKDKIPGGFWWNYCTTRYNSEYRRVLFEMLEPNADATLLDLGCGNGEIASKVAVRIGTKYINGVDTIPQLVESARAKGIKVYQGDINKPLPWHDEVFDVITASQIIEHLADTDTFLKEIHRMLKPNGYLVISTNNLASLHWIMMFIMGKQPPTACTSDYMPVAGFNPNGAPMHRRLFTIDGLTKLLHYHNFKIEKVVGSYYFPFPVTVARAMCRIDKAHSTCMTMKVRKV